MVGQEFPRAEHRRCARHIFANWHKSYKGDEMKMIFWNCAKAYTQADFNAHLTAMKEVDPRAGETFMACNPSFFCRAFISTRTTNNVIVNNMAETFNAYIINARSKHLIYMLEDIRTMLMQRLVTKKKKMEEFEGCICPNIQEKLEEEKVKAADCQATPASETEYQVQDGIEQVKVNLTNRTCTCRKWDVTGVPCCHAVAAIFDINGEAEDYVDAMFRKDTYLKAYNYPIGPCPGERHWPKVSSPLVPPPIKVGPRRPRKKRRRDPHEDPKRGGKLTKHGIEMTCSLCKSKEHNMRTCPTKGTMVMNGPAQKRGRGRPRKIRPPTTTMNDQVVHESATAQPSRVGRGGRVIKSGGRGGSRGGGRGGSRGGGRGGARPRVPQGIGVFIDDQGNAFTNSESVEPRSVNSRTSQSTSQPMTQVSSNM